MSLFANVLGQPLAVNLLSAALETGRIAPAYLLHGPEGVGRQLAGERFLEGLIAGPQGDARVRRRVHDRNHPDLLWVEPTYQLQGRLVPRSRAKQEGVSRRAQPQVRLEQIRAIATALARPPLEAPRSLVVLEGAEAMAEPAANALLKMLEEPGRACLLLICSAPDQLLSTIRSRCHPIPFRTLDRTSFAAVLKRVADSATDLEPIVPLLSEVLEAMAGGSPGALLAHRARWVELPQQLVEGLCRLGGSASQSLRLAADVSEALDVESQQWLLSWWQWWLWRQVQDSDAQEHLQRLHRQLNAYVQPRLAWELALLEVNALVRRWPSHGPDGAGP